MLKGVTLDSPGFYSEWQGGDYGKFKNGGQVQLSLIAKLAAIADVSE
jgi:hypothetical protein